MHSYIFDYFLGQKKYERVVAKIETRLTDLGLQGKNCHVGPLRSLKSIVKDEVRTSPKTIVAVGNNATLSEVINALSGARITIGIIPVGANNSLAELFGINDEDSGCTALSARLIETVDVGVINGYYFVSNASISNLGSIIEINGTYTVEPAGPGTITVVNLATNPRPNQDLRYGSLGAYVRVRKKGLFASDPDTTFIQTNRLIANNLHGQTFTLDDAFEVKPPAAFSAEKKALSVIVSKERKF